MRPKNVRRRSTLLICLFKGNLERWVTISSELNMPLLINVSLCLTEPKKHILNAQNLLKTFLYCDNSQWYFNCVCVGYSENYTVILVSRQFVVQLICPFSPIPYLMSFDSQTFYICGDAERHWNYDTFVPWFEFVLSTESLTFGSNVKRKIQPCE